MNARCFRVFRHDGRKIFGLKKFGRRKHVGFLNRSAARNCRTLVRIEFAVFLSVSHFRAAAGNRNFALARLRVRLYRRMAVRTDLREEVFAAHCRARIRGAGGREIDLTGIDVHRGAGLFVSDVILFHCDQSLSVHNIGSRVRKSDSEPYENRRPPTARS